MTFPQTSDFAQQELNHVMLVGQSLALGSGSTAISTVSKGRNRMFRGGILQGTEFATTTDYTGFERLYERTYETPASGFADYIASKTSGAHRLLITNSAQGGAFLSNITTGQPIYIVGLRHVREAHQRLGNKVRVSALICIHGEADSGTATYGTDLQVYQASQEADINGISARTSTLPVFSSQACYPGGSSGEMQSSLGMLEAHEADSTKNILVGPRYVIPHNSDGAHMPATSYYWLGAYYGKAYYKRVILGQTFDPLRPSTVVRSGANITVTYTGNVGDLVVDTTNVSDPGNYGFTYTDDSASASVSSVTMPTANTVVVRLNTTPTGANKKLRYGFNGAGLGGPTTGRRGCVRDSDTEVSTRGDRLYNWSVYFEKAAT